MKFKGIQHDILAYVYPNIIKYKLYSNSITARLI